MSAYYQLPRGMAVYEPGTATFSEMSYRLGAGNCADGSCLVRYDQRNFGYVALYLAFLVFYLILLLLASPEAVLDYDGFTLVMFIGVFGVVPLILLYYSFIMTCSVHWILCSTEGMHILRYSLFSIGRRGAFIPANSVADIVWDTTFSRAKTLYNLKVVTRSRRKRLLVYLDSSHERIFCLHAILKRRYAPDDDGIISLDDPGC